MADVITSAANPAVKRIALWNTKAKARREARSFVLEGLTLFHETPQESVREVFVSETFATEHPEIMTDLNGLRAHIGREITKIVTDPVFRKMSDVQTPQGILTVARMPQWTREDILAGERPPLIVIAERLQDPGNLGTIIRAAEAAGATGIAISADAVDPFSPKVVRGSMGSIFRVPVIVEPELTALVKWLQERGVRSFAAHLNASSDHTGADYTGGAAFLVGNEGSGLTDALAEAADARIRIPMEGEIESLNASVAAAILLYEAHRQRSM